MRTRRITRRLTAAMSAALLAVGAIALPATGATEHCDGHQGHEGKVEASESPETIVIDGTEVTVTIDGQSVSFTDGDGNPVTVEFCVKAALETTGDEHTGNLEGSSYSTTGVLDGVDAPETALSTPNGRNNPDISYVVVYGVVDNGDGDNGDGDNGDGDNGDGDNGDDNGDNGDGDNGDGDNGDDNGDDNDDPVFS